MLIILTLVLFGLAVSILGGYQNKGTNLPIPLEAAPTEIRSSRMYTVSYKSGVFSPTNLRIHAGDTVRFKNEGIFPINVVGDDLVGFDSVGDVPQGSFFAFTFAAKGIFSYHNEKSSDEVGTIMVR